jgi:hypothetical protein
MSTVAKVAKRPGPKTKPKSDQERHKERAAQRKSNLERDKRSADTKRWGTQQITKALKEFDRASRNAGPDVASGQHKREHPTEVRRRVRASRVKKSRK